MKFISALALIALIGFSNNALAQQAGPSIGCVDKVIRMQTEDLKLGFTKHGMEVYKDANVSIESSVPYPVAVQLNKGIMYQMIFVGSQLASDIRLELFDGDDKKIGEKLAGKMDPNYIIFSFIPEKTDLYLVVLSERLKKETICSSFTILRPPVLKQPEQTGIVPSENKYANPRYVAPNGQNSNTNQQYQNNTTPQKTNPRYVAPAKSPQKKTNDVPNNPRYVPQGK